MDFQKAFDQVPHKRLMSKLQAYNFHPLILNWINSFLTDRIQKVVINNAHSDWKPVTSCIPQDSVLGPVLFVIYVNDLPNTISSKAYLFADDTKLYRKLESAQDRDILQHDLRTLEAWSKTWLLSFHPEKCLHMHICKPNCPHDVKPYSLLNTTLKQTDMEKDLGVYIDNNLTFEHHIYEKVKKANSMMAMIRRTFKHLTPETFTHLYKSLVRTHLDYAHSIYFPYKSNLIDQIESVQRRATKQIPGFGKLSYPERLRRLNLPTLSYRRTRGDMIELYKITNHIYDKKVCTFIRFWKNSSSRSSSRTNSLKLFPQSVHTQIRRNAFQVRAAKIWNTLPEYIVRATSVNSFKNKLDSLWKSQDLLYNDYKSTINPSTNSNLPPCVEFNNSSPGSGVSTTWHTHESDVEEPCAPDQNPSLSIIK